MAACSANPEAHLIGEIYVARKLVQRVEDDGLLDRLLKNKHFQGHWWSYLLDEVEENTFEYWISRYVIPITIDQRYGKKELDFVRSIVNGK